MAPHTDPTAPNTPEAASFPPADLQTIERRWEDLGISGQAVTPFYQLYYDLPQGIQITALDENATGQGLCLGDILMAINGQPLAEPEDLTGLLRNKDRGAVLTLLIYRENESHTIHFTLGGAAK